MKKQKTTKRFCAQPAPVKRKFSPKINPNRMRMLMTTGLQWANGTEIKYFFIEGVKRQQDVVRSAFRKWKGLGIGLTFKEVKSVEDAMIRIGFDYDDGSWSYVGRENLTIPKKERTMNFGWDLTTAEGMSTALHEIGHALGLQHEHQSPFSGITWDDNAVIRSLSAPPNEWSKREIKLNILDKIPANEVKGTAWDPDSIMEYEFEPGLILKPSKYRAGLYPPGKLSPRDITRIRTFYPALKQNKYQSVAVNKAVQINAVSGGQNDFLFTPRHTKVYSIETSGKLDTVMIVTEISGSDKYYMGGDDDSGFDKNSKIKLPFVAGRDYLINIKVTYAPGGQKGKLIIK